MLYICIPSYNEAPTVGVLLWRIRKMFQEFSREYEVLVFDDASTDATAETLAPYRDVMPLTILGGPERKGYAAALDALCRAVSKRTRYPRRDAAIFLQADFTDQPEHIPELVKRFEGGADVVVAERPVAATTTSTAAAASASVTAPVAMPLPVRRLSRVAPWVLRPFVRVPGVRDPFGSFRLYRISVLRDVVRTAGARGVVVGDAAAPSWAANVELLLNAAAFARRVEALELAPRYDVRPRETRIRPFADAMGLFHFARRVRSRRLVPSGDGATADANAGTPRESLAAVAPIASTASPTSDATPPAARHAASQSKRGRRAASSDAASSDSASRDLAPPAQRSEASGTAPSSERRRSRRSRAERRDARPAASAGASERDEPDVAVDSAPAAPAAPRAEGRRERPRRGKVRASDGERPASAGASREDATPEESPTIDAAADGSESGAPTEGAAGAGADDAAALEARRQRQRARRKRSRQRRAAAARDGSPDQSSSTEAMSSSPTAGERPVSSHEGEAGAPSSGPATERTARVESGRDAEPAQTSPAASPVVP